MANHNKLRKTLDRFLDELSKKRFDSMNTELEYFFEMNPHVDKSLCTQHHNPDGSVEFICDGELIIRYLPLEVNGTLITFDFERTWLKNNKYEVKPMVEKRELRPTVLTQHIKDRKGLVATIVAVRLPDDNNVYFGWSKYHRSKEVKPFIKRKGRELAIKRAMKMRPYMVPHIVWDNLPSFVDRAKRYFKECKFQDVFGQSEE
jgi:hypothetical protein